MESIREIQFTDKDNIRICCIINYNTRKIGKIAHVFSTEGSFDNLLYLIKDDNIARFILAIVFSSKEGKGIL